MKDEWLWQLVLTNLNFRFLEGFLIYRQNF